jgi:hypothetical protein
MQNRINMPKYNILVLFLFLLKIFIFFF